MPNVSWTLAEGEHEGRPLLIRYRELPSDFGRGKYPHRINVFWTMGNPASSGLATPAESDRLEKFEDRLVQAVEYDRQSILSIVLTCNAQRELVFHTQDPAEFVRRLSDMPQEPSRYPIKIHANHDPDWAYDDGVIEGIERPDN